MKSKTEKKSTRVHMGFLVLMLMAFCFLFSGSVKPAEAASVQVKKNVGIIYIGDSRTVMMKKAKVIGGNKKTGNWTKYNVVDSKGNTEYVGGGRNNIWVVAKWAQGLQYLKSDVEADVAKIKKDNKKIKKWYIVSNFGVNDVGNGWTPYENEYKKLMKGDWKDDILILESVNPVGSKYKTKYYNYKQMTSMIEKFDKNMSAYCKTNKSVYFVNTYKNVKKFKLQKDQLHFEDETSKDIYAYVKSRVQSFIKKTA